MLGLAIPIDIRWHEIEGHVVRFITYILIYRIFREVFVLFEDQELHFHYELSFVNDYSEIRLALWKICSIRLGGIYVETNKCFENFATIFRREVMHLYGLMVTVPSHTRRGSSLGSTAQGKWPCWVGLNLPGNASVYSQGEVGEFRWRDLEEHVAMGPRKSSEFVISLS
jgi:hypothetical protein